MYMYTHMCLGHHLLVEADEPIYGALPDLQGREVREEVIANKETHEDPVINGPLGRGRGVRDGGKEGGREGEGGRGGEGGEGDRREGREIGGRGGR